MENLKHKEYIIIYVTAPNEKEALSIGKGLVEERLVACCSVSQPIRSIYHWQGEVCDEKEVKIILKSQKSLFEKIKNYIKKHHSYKVPQIIGVPICEGSESYLKWIDNSILQESNNPLEKDRDY